MNPVVRCRLWAVVLVILPFSWLISTIVFWSHEWFGFEYPVTQVGHLWLGIIALNRYTRAYMLVPIEVRKKWEGKS